MTNPTPGQSLEGDSSSKSNKNSAESRAEMKSINEAVQGVEALNKAVVSEIQEKRASRKSGATKDGFASAESLLGGDSSKPYVVKSGDNLSTIARKELGPKASEQDIYAFVKETVKLNAIKNPDLIHPGEKLNLPAANHAHGEHKADHKGADHKGADRKGADHKGADHKGADHKGADHKGADHKGADHKGADHKGADRKGADHKGADHKASEQNENAAEKSNKALDEHKDTSLIDWMKHSGDTLARQVAERTPNGGLMVLGPADTMRGEAEKYKDPDGYFPVFTHADKDDFHMYYGLHQGRKEYSVEAMAEMIKKCVKPGQPIRLLGCESGIDGKNGVAQQLAKLLPGNPVYAPNGYCELKDGKATVYLKKPSEIKPVPNPNGPGFVYPETPKGSFVRVEP